jgi:hypothetical protein
VEAIEDLGLSFPGVAGASAAMQQAAIGGLARRLHANRQARRKKS